MGIFIEAATEIQASKKVYQILLFKQMHNHLHDAFLPFHEQPCLHFENRHRMVLNFLLATRGAKG